MKPTARQWLTGFAGVITLVVAINAISHLAVWLGQEGIR